MNIHGPCPHCRSPLDWLKLGGQDTVLVRCRKCHCRWNVFGELLRWGKGCPALVRT